MVKIAKCIIACTRSHVTFLTHLVSALISFHPVDAREKLLASLRAYS